MSGILWRQDWPVSPVRWPDAGAVAWTGEGARVEERIARVLPTDQDRQDAAQRPAALRPDFLRRRRCLRLFVADVLDRAPATVAIASDAAGRPVLVGEPGIAVSTGAREERIALALATRPVGIDIEVLDGDAEPAWNVLAASERDRLRALPVSARWPAFLALWTAKEAYLKALGTGLRREASEIEAEAHRDAVVLRDRGIPVPVAAAQTRLIGHPGAAVRVSCVVLAAQL